jgi:hypothetical protein
VIKAGTMKGAALLLGLVLAALPALAAEETLFKGRDIDLAWPFLCDGKKIAAGRYGVHITYDRKQVASRVTVFKGEKDLCTVKGEADRGPAVAASKVRIFTRIDEEKKVIEIKLIMPSGLRSQIPDQVFSLPLADKG